MRVVVLLLVFVALAASQAIPTDTLPANDPRCQASGWSITDKSSSYVAGFKGLTKICHRDYVVICTGPTGILACNDFYGACQDVGYDWQDKELFPSVATNVKPQICAMRGNVMNSDVKILAIAQVMFGFFTFIGALVLSLGVAAKTPGAAKFILIAQAVCSLLLMFSWFYLNGIVQLAASIAAVALFRTRNGALTGVGILFLLSAYFWVTYQFGLGNMQHQSRFAAGLASAQTYENYCANFYRGYFDWNQDTKDIGENPAEAKWGFCDRNWLTTTLFFQLLAELFLMMLAATGIQALLWVEEKPASPTTSETEPVTQQQ